METDAVHANARHMRWAMRDDALRFSWAQETNGDHWALIHIQAAVVASSG
jgi:hypothetical protein